MYCAGDVFYYRNRFTGEIESLIVDYADEQCFSFLYKLRRFTVSYTRAHGKLFFRPEDVDSTEIYSQSESATPVHSKMSECSFAHSTRCRLSPCPCENFRSNNAQSVNPTAGASLPPTPSCDNCQLRRNEQCSELSNVLCPDYKAVPYISKEEKDSWPEYGDALAYRFGSR